MIKGPRVTSKNKTKCTIFHFLPQKHKVHKSTFDIGIHKSHHQQNKPVYSLLKIDFIMVHTSVRPH